MTVDDLPLDGSAPEPLAFVMTMAAVLALAILLGRHRHVIILRLPAQLAYVRLVTDAATQAAKLAGLDERAIGHCHVAVDEACTNIVRHAYADGEGGIIDARIEVRPGICMIVLTDYGKSYDPESVKPPCLGEALQPGGLGLYFMRNLMDEVCYTPSESGNRLVMIKRQPR